MSHPSVPGLFISWAQREQILEGIERVQTQVIYKKGMSSAELSIGQSRALPVCSNQERGPKKSRPVAGQLYAIVLCLPESGIYFDLQCMCLE